MYDKFDVVSEIKTTAVNQLKSIMPMIGKNVNYLCHTYFYTNRGKLQHNLPRGYNHNNL